MNGNNRELENWDPSAPQKHKKAIRRDPQAELALQRRKKKAAVVLAGCLVVLILALFYACDSDDVKLDNLQPIEPGVPRVYLSSLEIQTLGPIEGPYSFLEVHSPRLVSLARGGDGRERFELIGLNPVGYPAPDGSIPSFDGMIAFKATAIRDMLQGSPVWLIRMAPARENRPAQVYLFAPLEPPVTNPPQGEAWFVNARLLREGDALMALHEGPHPLYDYMAQSMLAAWLESQQSGHDDSIWNQFPLSMPLTEQTRAARDTVMPYLD